MLSIKVNRKFGGWRIEYDHLKTINAYIPRLDSTIWTTNIGIMRVIRSG